MRRALAPILFEEEEVGADRETRDPVLKPEPSPSVKTKKKTRMTPDGLPVHSFKSLLAELATVARVTLRVGGSATTFDQLSRPSPLHQRAFDLLEV